jgi:uncharacterized protein (DUF488 family)
MESTQSGVRLYTIGHSNRSLDEFIALLRQFGIETLADIRRLPGSRKFPHFDRENLERVLPGHGLEYIWLPQLGGLRRRRKGLDSPNMGLTSPGFRAYADYMDSDDFRAGIRQLLSVASQSTTAYMCAEALYWRCHRRLLSDYLVAHGVEVLHIMGPKKLSAHNMTEGSAVMTEGKVIYPLPLALESSECAVATATDIKTSFRAMEANSE